MEWAYWLLISVGIIVGILLAIAIVGCFLSRSHQVARSLALAQPPDAVWQVITDFAAVPSWQPSVLKVERMPDKNGHPVWKESYGRNFALFLETTEITPPTRLVRTIVDDRGPFTGRWEFVLTATATGCQLTITEFGEIKNPFFRVMARLYLKPEMHIELYLNALAKKLGASLPREPPA